jgi:hypothetical protein
MSSGLAYFSPASRHLKAGAEALVISRKMGARASFSVADKPDHRYKPRQEGQLAQPIARKKSRTFRLFLLFLIYRW